MTPSSPHLPDPLLPAFAADAPSRIHEQRLHNSVNLHLCAHNSLTPKGARLFLVTVAIGPILIAAYCVYQGFWPVLPFAGLELALLWLALRLSLRRGAQQEVIAITQDSVTILKQSLPTQPDLTQPGESQAKTRFPRHWTRVKLRGPCAGQLPQQLVLESGRRVCEVGRFLTEEERRALAARLQQLVGSMNESPAL